MRDVTILNLAPNARVDTLTKMTIQEDVTLAEKTAVFVAQQQSAQLACPDITMKEMELARLVDSSVKPALLDQINAKNVNLVISLFHLPQELVAHVQLIARLVIMLTLAKSAIGDILSTLMPVTSARLV